MSKLPVYGGPGARTARVSPLAEAAAGEGIAKLESRAEKASPTYQSTTPGPSASGIDAQTANAQTGQQQQQQSQQQASATDPAAAAVPPQYDLSADPVLQQVQAAVTLGNQQANASALNAREQALLQYGDPSLAASVLGANDPFVAAARGNQESTLALLRRAYQNGLTNFDNTLDPSLVYGGARIKGEGQIGQTYQDNLAQAAAGIQSQLGGITDTLTSAEQTNEDKLLNALATAYQNALNNALTNPPATGSSTSTSSTTAKPKKPKPKHSHIAHAAGSRPNRAA